MRLKLTLGLALASLFVFGHAQTSWEKSIAPGLVYRMEVNAAIPRIVHAIRLTLRSSAVKAVPELGGGKVYEEGPTKGRATLSEMVTQNSALGGINADFFPFTGDPLGLMVRDGKLISDPFPTRATVGWGPNGASAALASFDGTVTTDDGTKIKISGVNRSCATNEVVLNTPAVGISQGTDPTVTAVLVPEDPNIAPSFATDCRVEYLVPDATRAEVKPGTIYLVGNGTGIDLITKLHKGQRVHLDLKTTGYDWSRVENAIGGGPMLVKDGKLAIDWAAEDFKTSFANDKHPRTALGITEQGDLWFVTVDGRQESSDGMTLDELANTMLDLGCRYAINLDGGGSTTVNLNGLTLNHPSDGKERPVANAILFYGPTPLGREGKLSIRAAQTVSVDRTLDAKVFEADQEVPNGEVLWAATGNAWIDQGGTLHPIKVGKAMILAAVGKQKLSFDVTISKKATGSTTPVTHRKTTKPKKRVKKVVTPTDATKEATG